MNSTVTIAAASFGLGALLLYSFTNEGKKSKRLPYHGCYCTGGGKPCSKERKTPKSEVSELPGSRKPTSCPTNFDLMPTFKNKIRRKIAPAESSLVCFTPSEEMLESHLELEKKKTDSFSDQIGTQHEKDVKKAQLHRLISLCQTPSEERTLEGGTDSVQIVIEDPVLNADTILHEEVEMPEPDKFEHCPKIRHRKPSKTTTNKQDVVDNIAEQLEAQKQMCALQEELRNKQEMKLEQMMSVFTSKVEQMTRRMCRLMAENSELQEGLKSMKLIEKEKESLKNTITTLNSTILELKSQIEEKCKENSMLLEEINQLKQHEKKLTAENKIINKKFEDYRKSLTSTQISTPTAMKSPHRNRLSAAKSASSFSLLTSKMDKSSRQSSQPYKKCYQTISGPCLRNWMPSGCTSSQSSCVFPSRSESALDLPSISKIKSKSEILKRYNTNDIVDLQELQKRTRKLEEKLKENLKFCQKIGESHKKPKRNVNSSFYSSGKTVL